MNEVLPNREKRNSLKSVTIQQVDSDSIRNSSMHSEQNPDTKIVILHTEDPEGDKSMRAQQSQRILNQSFISRQKVGNRKPKSGVDKEIEENSHYRNVAPTHQFIRSFFASLNFVLRGILQEGVAASTRQDAQAKGLGEWLRARVVAVPLALLDEPAGDRGAPGTSGPGSGRAAP